MSTIQLETQKISLVQEILGVTDEVILEKLRRMLQSYKTTRKGRRIGILEGKGFFKEVGDGKVTVEELLEV